MQKILFLFLLLVLFCEGYAEKCSGKHEFYACGSDCDNECSTLGRQNRTNCHSDVKTCMCYCKDGYARNENNVCVPVDKCKKDQCWSKNEVLRCVYKCPPEKTCENRIIQFSCLRNDTETCENKCVCRPGYFKNPLGECISDAQCDQCSGDHEFFSCGSACDNECGKIGIQNRTMCPIVNIVCNERCYCEDSYSRNENNICVPNKKCPNVRCPGENENLGCVVDDSEPTCKNRTPESGDECDDCEPKCVCNEGLYRNEIGDCVSAEDCDKCPGKHEFFACGNECDNECSTLSLQNRTNCRSKNEPCIEKCYCADGYARDEDNVCVPVDQCPKASCDQNEIYRRVRNCPPEATCKTRNATYHCPVQGKNDLGEAKCICRDGYYRNYLKECISEADCDKCKRDHEFFACNSACDNRCASLDTVNRTNCDIQTFVCVLSCYCEDGYARDDDHNCIPVKKCTKGCGPHEYRMNCLQTCPPDECFSIVARFKCKEKPKKCPSGCRCQDGFLRETKDKPCMPIRKCPQLANSPDFN